MLTELQKRQIHGDKVPCPDADCEDGWYPPIGPCRDGSYITMRRCETCRGDGYVRSWKDVPGTDSTGHTRK